MIPDFLAGSLRKSSGRQEGSWPQEEVLGALCMGMERPAPRGYTRGPATLPKRYPLRQNYMWKCRYIHRKYKYEVPRRSQAEDSALGTPAYLVNISISLFKLISLPNILAEQTPPSVRRVSPSTSNMGEAGSHLCTNSLFLIKFHSMDREAMGFYS